MRVRWLIALCVIFACGLVGADTSLHLVQQQRITQAQASAASQRSEDRADYDALLSKYSKLYDQLVKAGETPSQPAPEAVKGDTGATGPVGPVGEAGRGIRDITCTTNGWLVTLTDGTVDNAGTCIGQTGLTGPAGESSTVAGPQGPAGADSTVPGPQGPSGADGVSVTGVTCVSLADHSTAFEFTFSNGSKTDVPGKCSPPARSDG